MLDAVRHRRSEHLCHSSGCTDVKDIANAADDSHGLGGTVRESNIAALLEAEIEGRPISTHALVIDEVGKDENGAEIEILFGALAMQQ